MIRLAFIVSCLAAVLPGGCAAPRGPIRVPESQARALWKGKHCGLGVSFEQCQKAWEASR